MAYTAVGFMITLRICENPLESETHSLTWTLVKRMLDLDSAGWISRKVRKTPLTGTMMGPDFFGPISFNRHKDRDFDKQTVIPKVACQIRGSGSRKKGLPPASMSDASPRHCRPRET